MSDMNAGRPVHPIGAELHRLFDDTLEELRHEPAVKPSDSLPTSRPQGTIGSKAAGRFLGITARQVTRRADLGTLPGEQVGTRWQFHREDLEPYRKTKEP
jgi:hypothetical protein